MLPADPRTLGATVTDGGTNFAIWSNAADAIELCLFNEVNGKLVEVKFTNGKVFINGASVVTADIVCDNGVIHVIDSVLLPK